MYWLYLHSFSLKSSEIIDQVKICQGGESYKFTEKQGEVIDQLLLEDEINLSGSGPDDVVTSLFEIGVISYLDCKCPENGGRAVGFTFLRDKLLTFFQRYDPFKEPLKGEFNLHDLRSRKPYPELTLMH